MNILTASIVLLVFVCVVLMVVVAIVVVIVDSTRLLVQSWQHSVGKTELTAQH